MSRQHSTGKIFITPYKRKVKHPRKSRYTSKAYRAFQNYLYGKYGSPLSDIMTDFMYASTNRMCKTLALQPGCVEPFESEAEKLRKAEATALKELCYKKYAAYSLEPKFYSRQFNYAIPKDWLTWEEEQGLPKLVYPTSRAGLSQALKAFV